MGADVGAESRRAFVALAVFAGALFGVGLIVSGMADPAKVIGFLDVTHGAAWDPTLAFVMGGAILVHAPLARLIRARRAPILGARFHVPAARAPYGRPPESGMRGAIGGYATAPGIDARLVGGAALFGIGWGLSGYCPGPALVSAASTAVPALVFTGALVVGIALARLLRPLSWRPSTCRP